MGTKAMKRILGAVLAAISLFVSYVALPAKVIADELETDAIIREYEEQTDFSNDPQLAYSPLVGEIEQNRTESGKHFRRADGAVEAVMYTYPVHFQRDGQWKDINNTLVPLKDERGQIVGYGTEDGAGVQFGKALSSEQLVQYAMKDTSVAWRFLGLNSNDAKIVTRSAAELPDKDQQRDMEMRFPETLSSEILYDDPETGISVHYVLTSYILSEFITLSSKPVEKVAFQLELTCDGLTPSVQEDNSIVFANDQGETVFVMSAPVMEDAKAIESEQIQVTFKAADEQAESSTYLYMLEPDMEWLQEEDRAYPVVIDPDIKPLFSGQAIDTYIASAEPNKDYSAKDKIKIASGRYEAMVYFDISSLINQLHAGDVVVEATINLSRYAGSNGGHYTAAYPIVKDWITPHAYTWNSFRALGGPFDASRAIAMVGAAYGSYFNNFIITDLVKKWVYGIQPNYGIYLGGTYYTEYRSAEYYAGYPGHPYFSLIYVNSTGLEDRFTYSGQSAGRAGTGNINLFTGNLTWTHQDATIANGALPISVSHVYNTNDRNIDIGYGYGWRINYAQSLRKVVLPDRTGTNTYYEWIDGDGTRHYYKLSSGSTYVNELDHDSVLTFSGTTATISDKGDNHLVFEMDSALENGRLIRVEDANDNQTLIAYTATGTSNLRIASVTEKLSGQSAGQSIAFSYTNQLLSALTVPDGMDLTFTYNTSRLEEIEYTVADGSGHTAFEYIQDTSIPTGANPNEYYSLSKVTGIDGYELDYSYTHAGITLPHCHQVYTVTEKKGNETGQSLQYDYHLNATTVTDANDHDTIYMFNNSGQVVCVRDTEGRALYAAYNTADQTVTQLSAVSKLQSTAMNLLKNGHFARNTDWALNANASFYGYYGYNGNRTARLDTGGEAAQTVSVTAGQPYTLSASVCGAAGAYLQIVPTSGSTITSAPVSYGVAQGQGWERLTVRFTATYTGTVTVKVVNSGSGYVYVDYVQFEKGEAPSRYNLVENADWSDGTNQYYFNGSCSSSPSGRIQIPNDGSVLSTTHPDCLGSYAYKIAGDSYNNYIYSYVQCNGLKGDTWSFGGWCYSDAAPRVMQRVSETSPYYATYNRLYLRVRFLNSSYEELSTVEIPIATDIPGWQYVCGSAVAPSSYTYIQIHGVFAKAINTAYFDGLQLYREEFSQAYAYDANGNLTGYTSLIGQHNSLTYDSNNNVTSSTDPRGNTSTYTYDEHHNLVTATSPQGVVTTNTYDDMGLVTETTVGNSSTYVRSEASYDTATGLTNSVTDARGNSVQYSYTSTTRQLTGITDPNSNSSTYIYDDAAHGLRLTSLQSAGTGTVTYGYDPFGRLSSVTHGSTVYTLTYDDTWNRPFQTKVGNTALSANTYDDDLLERVTYANGFSVKYEYDDLDRVTKIYHTENNVETLVYELVYNNEGNLYEQRNYRTGRSTFFDYDHAGRCMASLEKTFTVTNGVITYVSIVSSYRYTYDANNNLTKLSNTTVGQSWNTIYTYDGDNRPLTATFGNGKVMTNTYDAIGRITQRRLGLNSNYDTALTYKPGADGSQTALLATYQNGGDTPYSYEYDANGNITEITQGNVSVTYSYNAANELIRENNGFTNQTVTYAYDNWGNLTEKNVYAYTTATDPGTPTQTIPYAYTNSSWGDQLTSYNNQSIVYDAMGNPTSYLGQTLTWRGKQLTAVGTTTYEYDENGLRLNKTVNNVSTDYYYNGSVLMSLVTGNDTLLFSYDATGQVAAVNHNGTYYYYLRNGQGDIVKLIDNSGAAVVEYTYDTWGKQLSCTGSLASTLGALNPFRYRGYVYDEETQWYYLQSRYYNPEVCRFLSADSQIDRNAGIIGYNLYAYCANNPIIFQDDSGHSILDKIIGFFEMMVFGGGGRDFGGPGAGRDDKKYDECLNIEDQRRSTPSSQNNPAGDGIADKVQSPYQSSVSRITAAAEKGRIGEQASGLVKNTERIYDNLVSDAYYRIPDGLNHFSKVLSEVKNYSGKLSYTAQLRDFVSWCQAHDYIMDLYTNASVTKPLQKLIEQGIINKLPLN